MRRKKSRRKEKKADMKRKKTKPEATGGHRGNPGTQLGQQKTTPGATPPSPAPPLPTPVLIIRKPSGGSSLYIDSNPTLNSKNQPAQVPAQPPLTKPHRSVAFATEATAGPMEIEKNHGRLGLGCFLLLDASFHWLLDGPAESGPDATMAGPKKWTTTRWRPWARGSPTAGHPASTQMCPCRTLKRRVPWLRPRLRLLLSRPSCGSIFTHLRSFDLVGTLGAIDFEEETVEASGLGVAHRWTLAMVLDAAHHYDK